MSSDNIPRPPQPPALPKTKPVEPVEPTLASKVMSGATAVVAPVGAAAGAAAHALAEQSHRSLEKVEQSVATTETASASVRMSAAKSALRHHSEALRHSDIKTEDTEASGLPVAAAKISDVASQIPTTVASAAKTATATASSTLSCGAHAIAEKSLKGMETAEQAAAVSAVVPSQVRFAAASSALEHHEAAKKHAALKDETYESSGLSAVGEAIKSGYNTVVSGATNAYHAIVGAPAESLRENAADAAAAAASRQ